MLEDDPATSVIVIISKPPGEATLLIIRDRMEGCSKPVVTCFLGASATGGRNRENIVETTNLDAAVVAALSFLNVAPDDEPDSENGDLSVVDADRIRRADTQHYVRGVFAGGTFCLQAQQVFAEAELPAHPNSPLKNELLL